MLNFNKKIKINNNFKVILFLMILFLYISCNKVYATNSGITDEEKNKIANSQNAIDKITENKKKVQDTIKKLKLIKEDTQKYIEDLDKTLDLLVDNLNATLYSIDMKQIEINLTNENLDIAKNNEIKQYNDMKSRIKYFYEKGEVSEIESILTGDNLDDILTKAEYIQSLSKYDRKKLDELVEIKTLISNFENKLQIEKQELLILKDDELIQKNNIETLLTEKKEELESTNNKINTSNKELKKLQEEQKRQEAEIAAIERAILARSNSKRVLSGGLIWPIPGENRITSTFGKRKSPTKGGTTNHQGIDVGAKTGTTVVAAASGEVVISKYSYSAGNYIMIDHGSGIFTVYMHLSKRSHEVGAEVKQGQKIGEVGSTGYSTGPHLHFGIRKNGNYVNPLSFVG